MRLAAAVLMLLALVSCGTVGQYAPACCYAGWPWHFQ